MRTSYHNHTNWSDGAATLAEMIEGARREGLTEFGVSDHFVLAPGNRRFDWSMDPEFLGEYVRQVRSAIESTPDISIKLGLEVDYFPETIHLVKEHLSVHPFDYLIASVHFVGEFPIDYDARPWDRLSQEERDEMWRGYWQRLHAAADSRFFDFVGHFDLPKKFNFYPSVDLTEDALSALDSIAAADMAIEINTSGWDKPVQEAYPSLFYLREANRRGIPLVINADAHSAKNVAKNFDRARALALEAGYTRVVRYENRTRSTTPL